MSNERRVYERMPDGLTPLERRREANRRWRARRPGMAAQRSAQRRAAGSREIENAARTKNRLLNPELTKEKSRAAHLKIFFGITVAEYDLLFEKQGGVCAICKKVCSTGHALSVDHCHETGVIRGLLCRRCNRGIGHFYDNSFLLQTAVNYLNGDLI
jgi:hypothetical protein